MIIKLQVRIQTNVETFSDWTGTKSFSKKRQMKFMELSGHLWASQRNEKDVNKLGVTIGLHRQNIFHAECNSYFYPEK